MPQQTRLCFLGIAIALATVTLAGCDDKRRHGTGQEISFGDVEAPVGPEATPLDVGRAFLTALRDAQRTRAGGLGDSNAKAAYDDAIGRMQELAARNEIYKKVQTSGSSSIPPDVTEPAAMTLVCESWISMAAHYVEGFDLEQLTDLTQNPSEYATLYLQAANPNERQRVEELRSNVDGADNGVEIRKRLLAEGINPQIDVGIDIRLKHIDAGWRVLNMSIGPGRAVTWPPKPQSTDSTGS